MKNTNLQSKTKQRCRCVFLFSVLPLLLTGCGNSDTEDAPQENALVADVAVQPVEKQSVDTRKLPPDTPPVFPGEDVLLKHPETPELPFGIRKSKPERTSEGSGTKPDTNNLKHKNVN